MGIAQALLNEPKLLICDEPTSALDHVAVLHKGSLALNGTLTQLKQNKREDRIQITFG